MIKYELDFCLQAVKNAQNDLQLIQAILIHYMQIDVENGRI